MPSPRRFTRFLPVALDACGCNNNRSPLLTLAISRRLCPLKIQSADFYLSAMLQNRRDIISSLFDKPQFLFPDILELLPKTIAWFNYQWRYDQEFDMAEFKRGCKWAASLVSAALSDETKLAQVSDLMTSDCYDRFQTAVGRLAAFDSKHLIFEPDDCFCSFIHHLWLDRESNLVHIFVVMYVRRGVSELIRKSFELDAFASLVRDTDEKSAVIVNCEFVKSLMDPSADWSISDFNVFNPLGIANS